MRPAIGRRRPAAARRQRRQLLSRAAAYERPGVYTIRVEHDGYADWVLARVRVRDSDCPVVTAELVARLERLP